ncbi:MAG: hypothetical protein IPM02_26665 [Betaproteobacteria bacterium]|nr:hypothetical protein [Betaproteobacteria bacterium]
MALWLALGAAWMPHPAFAQSPFAGISNVFVIVMENHNWSQFRDSPSAPYINHTLLPMASYANAYYTPPGVSPSLPNYLWMEAGTGFGIADDADPFVNAQDTTAHLVTKLAAAGVTWKSYQESISERFVRCASTGRMRPSTTRSYTSRTSPTTTTSIRRTASRTCGRFRNSPPICGTARFPGMRSSRPTSAAMATTPARR